MPVTDEITNKFAEFAIECDFSVITSNGICGSHYLSEAQCALMCLRCSKQKTFDYISDLLVAQKGYRCKHNKHHLQKIDIANIIKETRIGKRQWVTDCLGIYSSFCNGIHDGFARGFSFGEINLERCSSVYFSNLEGQALLCYEVLDRIGGRRGGCFMVRVILEKGKLRGNGGAYIEGTASKMLLHAIENIIQQENVDSISVKDIDLYVSYANETIDKITCSYREDISLQEALKLTTDLKEKFSATPLYREENRFTRYLATHACPVCYRYYTSMETVCPNCKFELAEKIFLNRCDAELWRKEIVEPYKKTTPHIEYRSLYAFWASKEYE